jgi:hypothetical protein
MIHQPPHVFTQVKTERYQIWHLGVARHVDLHNQCSYLSWHWSKYCWQTNTCVSFHGVHSIMPWFNITKYITVNSHTFSNIEKYVFLNHCQCISITVCKWNACITHERDTHKWNYLCTLYHVIYFLSIDPYSIIKSIWIWK